VLEVIGVNGCKCSWLFVIVVSHYRGYISVRIFIDVI
jgi:hypothetical protein